LKGYTELENKLNREKKIICKTCILTNIQYKNNKNYFLTYAVLSVCILKNKFCNASAIFGTFVWVEWDTMAEIGIWYTHYGINNKRKIAIA
jgi:hypothetical protein